MHYWGDGFEYFNEVSEAAGWIGEYLIRWGRINVSQTKEKFGTARVSIYFGWHSFHSLTHPEHHYNRYPNWLWILDCRFGSILIRPLNWLAGPYHKWLYRRAYAKAIAKWPMIRAEILQGADYSELLEGL